MNPAMYDLSLGDRKEEFFAFGEGEAEVFLRTIGRPELACRRTGSALPSQLLASRAVCGTAAVYSCIAMVPIQQEVIFSDSVYANEILCLKTEVIGIEQSRGWVTFSLEVVNSDGGVVMAGQVVMAFAEQGAGVKNA
jgi:hypothetical protein